MNKSAFGELMMMRSVFGELRSVSADRFEMSETVDGDVDVDLPEIGINRKNGTRDTKGSFCWAAACRTNTEGGGYEG